MLMTLSPGADSTRESVVMSCGLKIVFHTTDLIYIGGKNMKKIYRIISVAVCLLMVFSLFAACGPSEFISYSGKTLVAAKVGTPYDENVGTASGATGIKYSLKTGNTLPVGLILDSTNGSLTGTPRNKSAEAVVFTIVASAEGLASSEASFTIPAIAEGTLTFSEEELPDLAYNRAYSASITAVGAASAVTYTKTGDLPMGLSFNNGVITGTPTVSGEEKTFSVTASANDCASITEQFTLKVITPWLTYSGSTLMPGTAGDYYSAVISTATGSGSAAVTYSLKDGSTLPGGLSLSVTGFLSGTPTAAVSRHNFTVIASSTGYTSAEATFTLTIASATVVGDKGTITYPTKALVDVYVMEAFNTASAVASASADNRATVSYVLAAGSTLPGDLTILPNGTLMSDTGAPASGEFTFSVVATAAECDPVTTAFKLNVLPQKLIFEGFTFDEMAMVGDACSYSVATANTPNGESAAITYSVKSGSTLPAGLSLSGLGVLSGTPTTSKKGAYIGVTASANGFTSVSADIYLSIKSPRETATRFEMEYVDLTGIVGAGFSGSAREEEMILPDTAQLGASNGYYLTFTYSPMLLVYRINSDKAVTNASLWIGLSSEIGNITLDKTTFDIQVNKVSVISSFEVEGGDSIFIPFQRFLVSSGVSLIAGENIIEIEILPNNLLAGRGTGAPAIDYIELTNLGSSVLSWIPMKWNI